MNRQEQVRYLANVYCVLKADGNVQRVEEQAFEVIARDIGAGYFERRRAVELAQPKDYSLQLVGRWSDRIRNLEDMLYAAFCNGIVQKVETGPIKGFAARLGITQEQLDLIKRETKSRYKQSKPGS